MYYYFFLFFFFNHSLIPGKRTAQEFPQTTMYRPAHDYVSHEYRLMLEARMAILLGVLQLHRWHLILRQHSVICATLSSNFSRNPNHRTPPRQAPVTKRENYRARINTNYQDLHRETGLKMLKCRNRESNETVSRSGWYVLIIERGRGWPMNKSDIIARPTS